MDRLSNLAQIMGVDLELIRNRYFLANTTFATCIFAEADINPLRKVILTSLEKSSGSVHPFPEPSLSRVRQIQRSTDPR